jgi:hypothetical protein
MQIAAWMTLNIMLITDIENRATRRERSPGSRLAFRIIRAGARIKIASEIIAARGQVQLDDRNEAWWLTRHLRY